MKRLARDIVSIARVLLGAGTYYHTTKTSNVSKIKKKGLVPLQTSNWVKGTGERYGNGEIFVFEKERDAIRWASKMDWALNTKMGSGKISVIEIHDTEDWDEDSSDPLGHLGSEGKWLKRHKAVAPKDVGRAFPVTIDKVKSIVLKPGDGE